MLIEDHRNYFYYNVNFMSAISTKLPKEIKTLYRLFFQIQWIQFEAYVFMVKY